jgi:hypothetical protein
MLVDRRHQHQLERLAREDTLERRAELLGHIMDSRNDDRHLLRRKGWLARDGNRLVTPVADAVNNEPQVSVDPEEC